jgi:hypothetical protein
MEADSGRRGLLLAVNRTVGSVPDVLSWWLLLRDMMAQKDALVTGPRFGPSRDVAE